MNEAVLAAIASYGPSVLALITFLSCLALPVPSSLAMLGAGAFAASGDLSLFEIVLAALLGAVLGDQTGYALGKRLGGPLLRAASTPARARLLAKARRLIGKWGGLGVFFSRWLASPLGPYVNLLAPVGGLPWWKFTVWGVLGEVVWVAVYVGLGWAFASSFGLVADLASTVSGLIAALAVMLAAGAWLWYGARQRLPKSAGRPISTS